jgi:diguanylate cyclase (GGDEF)-like protein
VSRHSATSGIARTRATLAIAVVVIAAAVWGVSHTQRSTAERVFEESAAAERMLTAMLDQETGLRGFALTRERSFLEPFDSGERDFDAAADDARAHANGLQRRAIGGIERTADRWRVLAEQEVALLARFPARPLRVDEALRRKRVFDSFRRQSAAFSATLTKDRHRKLDQAGLLSVLVIVALAAIFGGFGFTVVEREAKRAIARRDREREYRRTQAEFAETMQVMRNEAEAHDLVKNHLERVIDGGRVTVLNRNNSDNRLYAATPVGDDARLDEKLVDAEPDSCLSVRLGRQYEQGAEVDPLLSCDLCGKSAADVVCTPSLVGGEVIGSVLVRNERALRGDERDRISESVAQASPVLANLRNLAIAETRAATDALTGLPNARSCRDNLKRMVAHAGRTVSPLSAVMLDLDHFKRINDRYGHGTGDDVLASVGEVLRSTLRSSDFGGRFGGEEFLMLLPSTDQHGALELSEKIRHALTQLEFQQPDLKVSASFGIATYPLDALDADSLLRMADRALYVAKSHGRDRIELVDAASSGAEQHHGVPTDA